MCCRFSYSLSLLPPCSTFYKAASLWLVGAICLWLSVAADLARLRVQRLSNAVYYLRIENAEGYVLIAVYLFILYACYSHNKKSFKPNRMTFGGMIGYYPGTI